MLECKPRLLFDDFLNLGKVAVDINLLFSKFRQDQAKVVTKLLAQ